MGAGRRSRPWFASGTLVPVTSTPVAPADPTPALPESARRRPRGQGWLIVLGLLAAAPAAAATVLRVLPPSSERLAKLASFIPYGLVFWLPALLLLGAAAARALRHRTPGRPVLAGLSLVAAAGVAATVAWQAPAFIADSPVGSTGSLTITSLNVAGVADPAAAARAAVGADVAVFVEARPGWVASLPRSFRSEFPYRAPKNGAGTGDRPDSDTVVFSRHPIVSAEALPESTFQQWSAVVRLPRLGPVRVVAVHPCNPYCRPGLWAREAEQLRSWLAARRDATPTVVAGDFNAVDDHLTMRDLYADGFRSAADLAGAGFVRTWPANRTIPPMIGIDHILVTPGLTASAFDTFEVPGTDHLGVRALIAGTTPG